MNPEKSAEENADPKDPAKTENADVENKDLPVADEKDVKGGAAYMKYDPSRVGN